ncbi:histidine phosphatase family protein [Paraglaciecola sp. 20A4]|uniref:histidine phosphatase family protein n=1 Tax=Paraglaciecola sp. 20A4 TaxID=2687288 RepID=UPI0014098701|nr:histidine phosphatase family protein [Paraglaciecola sp. 20A4]
MTVTANHPITKHFYLCRHGQSEFNAKGILQGRLESSLTELGRQQAHRLAIKAQLWNIQHIASSNLSRAQQTAKICAQTLGVTHECVANLAERQLGCWQGQPVDELSEFAQFQKHCYQQTNLPAGNESGFGETTDAVRQRMQSALITLAKISHRGASKSPSNENILIVSHGDALACLMSLFTAPILVSNTQGYKLIFQQNKFHWGGLID